MRKIMLLFLVSLSCLAQAAAVYTVSAVGPVLPGSNATFTVVQSGGNTALAGPSGFQLVLTTSWPQGSPSTVSVTAAGTAVAAGKTASINPLNGDILVAGLNQNSIADGTVLTISVPVPASAACPGNSACQTLSITPVVASTTAGTLFASSTGGALSVFVSGNCDVDKNGLIDGNDATAEKSLVSAVIPTTTTTAATGDRDGDGHTTVIDYQIIVNATLGKGCTAVQ